MPRCGMDQIDRIRAFNRFYSNRAGLLARSYLGSGLTVTEARVLYEIAAEGADNARVLAGILRLDEGHLSRIVTRFERAGWIERRPAPGDARRRVIALTAAGQETFQAMAGLSRTDVEAMLAGLGAGAREALTGAMSEIVALLSPDPDPDPITLRDLAPGDPGWVISQHGALYAADEGYDAGFEALVARIVAEFVEGHDPDCERGWIAERAGRRLGCIFCVREDATTARLRMFLTVPEARGQGLGQVLLDACLGYARAKDYEKIVLWTHESHQAACALYRRAGFVMTASAPGHDFGVDVVDQTWELALA